MLRVYKEVSGTLQDPEKYFNRQIRRFDFSDIELQRALYMLERAEWIGEDKIKTPYGKGTVKDLKVATKLALCLIQFPAFMFDSCGIKGRDLENVLKLSDGTLYLRMEKPIEYLYMLDIKTGSGVKIPDSTSLNIWYFGGVVY